MTALEIYALWFLLKLKTEDILKEIDGRLEDFLQKVGVSQRETVYDFIQKQSELLKRTGAQIISLSNELYPELLKEIPSPPPAIFCLGNCQLLREECLTIVGTRKATNYGLKLSERFSEVLSEHFVIVSGMAFGIDAHAHIGAMKGNGKTIAVLASGVDTPTPKSNQKIYDEILKNNGAVLSMFPLTYTPKRYSFIERNSLLAGLSVGTLVVEAPIKSGALVTARLAAEYGRDVFTIPGDVGRKTSEGTNYLLKIGAIPVTSPEDILNYYGIKRSKNQPKEINDPIYLELKKQPRTPEELSAILNIHLPLILAKLTELELQGYIYQENGVYKTFY